MLLSEFTNQLIHEGKVNIDAGLEPFETADIERTKSILFDFYKTDIMDMPYQAPDFSNKAALWAAEYICRIIQFTMNRELEIQWLDDCLMSFKEDKTPEIIYSADLCLRYLPEILKLAKGMAPGDALLKHINDAALIWPFSSVGIDQEQNPDISIILENKSLKSAYIDRIMIKKDHQMLKNPKIISLAHEALGDYFQTFETLK